MTAIEIFSESRRSCPALPPHSIQTKKPRQLSELGAFLGTPLQPEL